MEKDQEELLKIVTSFLEKNKIPYFITGAWSAIFYSKPRASHDIDFVVELYKADIKRVTVALSRLGSDFLFQKEVVKEAILKKGNFGILYLPTALKLDFWILEDELFARSMFNRRRRVKMFGQAMLMASAEDTILQKLRWYKEAGVEKHLIDAAFVYQIQDKNLDKKYLEDWASKLKVEGNYKKLGKINLENYW